MFKKVFYFLAIFFMLFMFSGCANILALSSNALDTSLCNKGYNKYCTEPGTNNIHSELINKKLESDTFDGSAGTTQKGYFQLGMACSGEYNNASLIYDNANSSKLVACSSNTPKDLMDPLSIKYCYYDQNGREISYGVLGHYLPSSKACAYRYYAENEMIDELFEHKNDKKAAEYIKQLQAVYKFSEDELIRLAVLQLPSIKRDESRALQNFKNACVNVKKFKNIRYAQNTLLAICGDYEFIVEVNTYLCKRYSFKSSCDAVRSLR